MQNETAGIEFFILSKFLEVYSMEKTTKIPTAVVVNDDLTQLNILCGLLKKAGVEYASFTNAQEALKSLAHGNPPEIIISDVYMPGGLDGWRFCRMLRSPEYKKFNKVPILIVSATYSGDEPAKITSDLGANAFLSLPLDGKEFISTIYSLINGKKECNALHVLVVEDSKVISKQISLAFQNHGFLVDKVDSLGQALSQIDQSVYDIAVADFNLNDNQGAALLEKIQSQCGDCVCIMLTADERPELAMEWAKKGVDAYLRKPFDPEYVIMQCEHFRRERAFVRIQDLLELRTSQLRESEYKFRQTFDVSPAGIVLVGLDTRFIRCNLSFSQSLGYEPEELVGKLIEEVTLPEDRQIGKPEMVALVKGEIAKAQVQKRYISKDGQVIWGEVTISLIRDSNGQVQYYLALIQNITERKQIEEKLLEEAARRIILMDQSRDGIVIINQDGKVVESNRKFADMLGYSIESMSQLSVFDWEFLVPRKRLEEMIKNVDETGDHFETKHRRKDGSVYDVEISTNAAIFDEQKLIFCVCRDITERKSIEQDLYLKSLVLDQIQDHVTITDLQGNITYINQAETKTFGLPLEQVVGKSTSIYGENAQKGATQREIVEKTLRDGIWRCEVVNYAKDGSEHYMDCRTQVVKNGDGKPVALCGIATDITERKKIEESLILSEEKFSKAFKTSPDSININRLHDGLYLEINEGFTNLTGYSANEVLGKTSLEINIWGNPQDRERLVKGLREKGEVQNLEAPFRIKNGEIKICLMSARIINVNNEQCILSITRDITDRKQVEQALSESEEKYRILFEQAPDGVVILEQDTGRIIEFNDQVCHQLGYTREELATLCVADIEVIESAEDVRAHIQNIISSGHDEFVTKHRTKQGEIRDIQVIAQVVIVDEKLIYHCIWRDVTERKLAERTINEQLKELQRWHSITMGREDRIMELKREVNKLLSDAGNPPRYSSVE